MIANIFAGAVLVQAVAASAQVSAQPAPVPPGATIVFVSSQRISNDSADGRAGQLRVQALQRERAAELRQKQQAHEVTRQQLGKAAPADRPALQQQEQQQRSELELSALRAQADTQNLQREIALEIQAKVKTVLDELLKGTDVQVVLQSENAIVWAAPGLDVTAVVVERLNARPPSGEIPAGRR